jgi:hypothetical protein
MISGEGGEGLCSTDTGVGRGRNGSWGRANTADNADDDFEADTKTRYRYHIQAK